MGFEGVELAAEGDEAYVGANAGHSGNAVGVETGTVDEVAGGERASSGVDGQAVGAGGDGEDSGTGEDLAAGLLEEPGVGVGDFVVVYDGGLGGVDGLDTVGAGLDFSESLQAYDLKAGDAVGRAPAVKLLEGRDLGFLGGYDDFAAVFVVDAVLVAELFEESGAAYAVLRLQGAGAVVDARVDAAVVVAGLVLP